MLQTTDGGSGAIKVEPAELDAAAGTLRSVLGELHGHGPHTVGATGVGDLGFGDLTAAVQDLSARAGDVATTMAAAVSAAARNTSAAGHAYTVTDNSAMPGGHP